MDRSKMISQLEDPSEVFDFLVIGGGATGIGIALDASTRGYRVALFEQSDFTKGTSSRSTKLVHGGVRYLAQGDVSLVLEALRERGLLRQNAPHLVKDKTLGYSEDETFEIPEKYANPCSEGGEEDSPTTPPDTGGIDKMFE